MKKKCVCGVDITTMRNLDKRGRRFKFWCKKCGQDVTKIKLLQFIDNLREKL
jgi:predicted SprT family Zn-dependent metalloprotease